MTLCVWDPEQRTEFGHVGLLAEGKHGIKNECCFKPPSLSSLVQWKKTNAITKKDVWDWTDLGKESFFIQQKLTGVLVLANVCVELMKRTPIMYYRCLIRQKWKSPFYWRQFSQNQEWFTIWKDLDLLTWTAEPFSTRFCFLLESFLSSLSFITEGWITIPKSVIKVSCKCKVWGSFHMKYLLFKTKPPCKAMEMHKMFFV